MLRKEGPDVAGPLMDPLLAWADGDARQLNTPAADVHEDKQEVIDPALGGPDFLLQEIASPQRLGMALDEVSPGAAAALRIGIEPGQAADIESAEPVPDPWRGRR